MGLLGSIPFTEKLLLPGNILRLWLYLLFKDSIYLREREHKLGGRAEGKG